MIHLLILGYALLLQHPCEGYLQTGITPVLSHVRELDNVQENSGIAFVDCIYVINLEERPKKWKTTQENLIKCGLNPTRFPAINGWNLTRKVKTELFGPYDSNLRGGEIGCLLSHLSVMQDAKKRNFSLIWICEDDIEILEDPKNLENVILELSSHDPEWDILFTDRNSKNSKGTFITNIKVVARPDQPLFPLSYYKERIIVNDKLEKVHLRVGCYSYLVSERGIRKILDYYAHVYLWPPIDIDLFFIPSIRIYGSRKDIISINWRNPISDTQYSPPKILTTD